MSEISLSKGQSIAIEKAPRLKVTLGWKNPAGRNDDLDACAFLLGKDGIIANDADMVFYGSDSRSESYDPKIYPTRLLWKETTRPVSSDGSVIGAIDDEGNAHEAHEVIEIDLSKVAKDIERIMVCAAVFNDPEMGTKTTLDDIHEPSLKLHNLSTGMPLANINLPDDMEHHTALVGVELRRDGDAWALHAPALSYAGGLDRLIDLYA